MKRSLALLFALFFLLAPAQAQQFGGTAAVGDGVVFIGEARNQMDAGTVYVYDAEGNETARLRASDAGKMADGFGQAMAYDAGRLLVGARGAGDGSGAAYVFERGADGAWTETARLTPSLTDGAFGAAVALDGDRALLGAPVHAERTGTAYVFERSADGTWAEAARLAASDGAEGVIFGNAVALDGDLALIGAPRQEENTGAVYAYRHDGADWMETDKLSGGIAGERSLFGNNILLEGGTAFVGAERFQGDFGAVFAFTPGVDRWTMQALLVPFDGDSGRLGSALAYDTDANALWVGAPRANGRAGALYRFFRDENGAWTSSEKVSDGERGDGFGNGLALGGGLALVGRSGADFGAGLATLYRRDGDAWASEANIANEIRNFAAVTGAEVKCEEGEANAFGCDGVDLLSFLPVQEIGGARGVTVNDLWGWVDPTNGREYALVGRRDGTSFIDVSDPFHPTYLGDLPMTEGANAAVWRDIKVYQDHAFIVSDGAGAHGMQVFDLARLRDVPNAPVTFDADALYDDIFSAHNIVINEETGFAYSVGSRMGGETCGGGLHMIDIREPKNPTFVGCFADATTGRQKTGYSHDAQCVNYLGPDAAYQGREICFGSNENALSIADVTDKENPKALSMASYPNVAYTHQGWLTEDQRYFYMNDEGDEAQGLVEGTRTLIWDVSDLDDPQMVAEHIAEEQSIDHNLYIKGNLMYQSNYVSGLRILDITDPTMPVEVGYFDTVPYGENAPGTGGGSWSNYPYFPSGIIVVTSGREGVFILKKRDVDI